MLSFGVVWTLVPKQCVWGLGRTKKPFAVYSQAKSANILPDQLIGMVVGYFKPGL